MEAQTQKLSIVEKVGYSLGDSAANFIFQTVMMFLMFFYTDIMGISPAIAGYVFLVTRILEAINDPMMGAISDRTNTRWGKYRPWVIGSALPFSVIGILMFTAPDLSVTGKVVYAFITYNFMMIIYTVNNVPYCALTGVLTGDNIERTSLASYRFFFAMLASFVVQGLSIPMVNSLGVDNTKIVQSEVTGDQLTLHPKGPGLVRVLVKADDKKGNVTEKDFTIKVTKPTPTMPVIIEPIGDLALTSGFKSHEIDLTKVFNPGANGPVTYKATIEDEQIASAQISGSTLVLKEKKVGVTKVTVTVTDDWKVAANDQFTLAIQTQGNTAPTVKNEPKISLDKGFKSKTLDLGSLFQDGDGDKLTFTAKTANAIVRTEVDGGKLVVTESITGYDRVTVTANDGKGGWSSLVIPVVVKTGANMAPAMTAPLNAQTLAATAAPLKIDLSEHFTDPDDDAVAYEATVVNQAKGYQRTMIIFCSLALLFFVVAFFTTKERVQPDPKQVTSLKQDLSDLVRNPTWVALVFLTIFVFIYLALRGSVTLYYFTYYVKRTDLFSYFNMLGMGLTLAGIPLSKPLAVRFGKRNTFLVCLLLTAIFTTAFVFFPPTAIVPIFVSQGLAQFSYAITIPLLWAMIADVADYSEWKTGRRATGMTFSATTFGLKMGLSLGGAMAGWLLTYFGYVAGLEQTERTLSGIKYMMSIIPAVPFFIGVVILFFYKINKETEFQMQEELIERRKKYEYE
jgi:Na+/melibiose symporter-like transporter